MSAASPTAEPGAAAGPDDQGANRSGRLLGLVRKLVAYGRDLVATLQQLNTPTPSVTVARSFGTVHLAVIIARITRGLAIAAGLEARLVRNPPVRDRPVLDRPQRNPDRPTAFPAAASPRPRPARRPTPSQSEDDAALLRGLPSAEEIAERIRRRPAGAVIVEICRDLGINTAHPLWRDVRDAIIQYGGNLVTLLKLWLGRGVAVFPDRLPDGTPPPLVWGGLPGASTDPP